MSERWIALHCGDDTDSLIENHPNAFLLLVQIAKRAKWKPCSITKLKAGQAMIGDWRSAGLPSEKAYRHAKEILANCRLAAFEGRARGTIATLMDTRIFSITNDDKGGQRGELGADKGRTGGELGATNHTDTQIHGHNDTHPPTPTDSNPKPLCTLAQAKAYAPSVRMTPEQAEHWWKARDANGWMKSTQGGHPIKIGSWQSDMSHSLPWVIESLAKSEKANGNPKGKTSAAQYGI